MVTYRGTKRGSLVTVGNSNPVKLFSTPARGRAGYRVYNPSDANDLLIIEVMAGSTAPTATDFTNEDLDYRVPSNKTQDSGAGDTIDVYGLMSASSANVAVRELFAPREALG